MLKFLYVSAFLIMVLLTFSIGEAFAADEASFSRSTPYISAGDNQNAGKVTIEPDDDVTVCGAVYITLTLPDGVEFSNTPGRGDIGTGKLVQKSNVADSGFDSAGEDRIKIWISGSSWSNKASPIPKVTFDFSSISGYDNNKLDIDNDFEGNLDVSIDVEGVTAGKINWSISEEVTIAKVNDSGITIKAGDLKKVPVGRDKESAKITVEESTVGLIENDKKIRLQIETEGVEFGSVTVAGEDMELSSGTAAIVADADGNKTIAEITVKKPSVTFPGTIKFDPIMLNIDPDVTGEIEITVSSDDSDVDEETVTVAEVGESDLIVTVDEETGMEEHMRKASVNELWEMTIETNGKYEKGDKITITLPDNFEFYKKAVKNLPISEYVDCLGTFDGDRSIWLEINDAGDGEDEITLSNLFVGSLPDAEYGDINVEIGGDIGHATVKVGLLKPGVIPQPEQTYVVRGHNQLAGNITFTETDKDAIDNGVKFFMTLPNGVTFASKPTVTVNGEKIDGAKIGPGEFDDDVCQITIDKFRNSQIDSLVVSDIRYDVMDWLKPGEIIKVKVGGNDSKAEDNFNQFYESLMLGFTAFVTSGIDSWDDFQFRSYADATIVEVPNAIMSDSGRITASFSPTDDGVYVEGGRTLVQVNLLTDKLGLQKSWDEATKTAYFVKEGKTVAFPVDQNKVYVNNTEMPVDQGAKIINGFTCVTLRGLEMAFGGELAWDDETKTATFIFN